MIEFIPEGTILSRKDGQWHLYEPFTVIWPIMRPMHGPDFRFTVSKGFKTDLASIPRACRSIIPQVGRHIQAAIAHDWCYGGNVPGMTRAQADELFLDGMEALGVNWFRRRAMYAAVRMFGGFSWKG